jgi:hypothetical protein
MLYLNDKKGDIEIPSPLSMTLSMQTLLPTGVFWMTGRGPHLFTASSEGEPA